MRIAVISFVVAVASVAWADEGPTLHAAFAVNPPFNWNDASSLGGSLYVGVTEHQVIRANIASYINRGNQAGRVIVGLLEGDEDDEATNTGRTTDYGIGWQYFPRRRWDGFSVELGSLLRVRDIATDDEYQENQHVGTDSKVLAARALVGWSWLFYDHVFISVAAGLSCGYEWGRQTTHTLDPDAPMAATADIHRVAVSAEGFVRLGFVFDVSEGKTAVRPR